MENRQVGLWIALAWLAAGATGSVAAPLSGDDPGRGEFLDKCAVCHGSGGKGDGGLTELLRTAPSDLTVLSKNNGGVFPLERVYAVIDGREAVKAHGPRDMPVWGRDYLGETGKAGAYYVDMPYTMEMYARTRIMALIDYLNRLQTK